MGRKAKRMRVLQRIENFKKLQSEQSKVIENSVAQEQLKTEIPPVETEPSLEQITQEMTKEVEELVKEIKPKPKPKRTKKPRATKTTSRARKKTVENKK